MLMQCINRVYLRGCEKVHLGKLVDTEASCPEPEKGEGKGAGSLVIHIRSGDIFNPNTAYRKFGQVRRGPDHDPAGSGCQQLHVSALHV